VARGALLLAVTTHERGGQVRGGVERDRLGPRAALRGEHEGVAVARDHAGPAMREQRRVRLAKRERELIRDLEAGELAHLAIAVDEPAIRAVEHAHLAQRAEHDLFAAL